MALKAKVTAVVISIFSVAFAACSNTRTPLDVVDHVDLPRFMGKWFVIASIPTYFERDIYNAVETYQLADDGSIETTFTFRKGGFDRETKTYQPTAVVRDSKSNAIWGMQFIWPFESDYRIIYLSTDYQQTVIGRNKRDYAWIMARKPSMAEEDYALLVELLREVGYDVSNLKRVPQRWE